MDWESNHSRGEDGTQAFGGLFAEEEGGRRKERSEGREQRSEGLRARRARVGLAFLPVLGPPARPVLPVLPTERVKNYASDARQADVNA